MISAILMELIQPNSFFVSEISMVFLNVMRLPFILQAVSEGNVMTRRKGCQTSSFYFAALQSKLFLFSDFSAVSSPG
jgi:hypothetical protein